MAKFFVKRILTAIVQIFVVTTIVFFALQMMPRGMPMMQASTSAAAASSSVRGRRS